MQIVCIFEIQFDIFSPWRSLYNHGTCNVIHVFFFSWFFLTQYCIHNVNLCSKHWKIPQRLASSHAGLSATVVKSTKSEIIGAMRHALDDVKAARLWQRPVPNGPHYRSIVGKKKYMQHWLKPWIRSIWYQHNEKCAYKNDFDLRR